MLILYLLVYPLPVPVLLPDLLHGRVPHRLGEVGVARG